MLCVWIGFSPKAFCVKNLEIGLNLEVVPHMDVKRHHSVSGYSAVVHDTFDYNYSRIIPGKTRHPHPHIRLLWRHSLVGVSCMRWTTTRGAG